MEDRLNGLAIMSVFRDMPLDKKKIVTEFLSKKQRRILAS
jgi:hypothetical protein